MYEDSRKLTLLRVFYYQSHLLQNYPFPRLPILIFSSQTPFFHLKAQFHSFQNQFFPFQSSVSASWDLVFFHFTLLFHPPHTLFFLFRPYSTLPEAHFSHFTPSFIHLKSQSQLSQTLFSYHNRFKPVFKNACILVLGIRK